MSEEQARYDTRSPVGRGDAHRGLKQTILDYLDWHHAYVFCPEGWHMQAAGAPDIVVCLGGRFIGIEIKTGTATLQKKQREHRRKIVDAHGIWILARSADDVEHALVAAGLVEPSLQ